MSEGKQEKQADSHQTGPGERIRLREDRENINLDNLRGGADPLAGHSSEVPRDNKQDNLPDGESDASQQD